MDLDISGLIMKKRSKYKSVKLEINPALKNFPEQILLSREQIEQRLREGENPISLEVEKWKRLLAYISGFYGPPIFADFQRYYQKEARPQCLAALAEYKRRFGLPDHPMDRCFLCPLEMLHACNRINFFYARIMSFETEDIMKNADFFCLLLLQTIGILQTLEQSSTQS